MRKGEPAHAVGLTLDEIARRLGISRARVQQLEARALKKMAKRARALGLRFEDFVPSR